MELLLGILIPVVDFLGDLRAAHGVKRLQPGSEALVHILFADDDLDELERIMING